MQIIVNSFTSDNDTTINTFFIDNDFICFSLEDKNKDKIKNV